MARLRHLVVVIPGIGGSALDGQYDLTATGLVQTLVSPARLRLDRNPHLTPTNLVSDFTVLPPLLTLPGYQRLGLHLYNAFDDLRIDTYQPPKPIDPKTDVLKFPYDFRRSVVEAAVRLNDAVEEALRHRPVGPDDTPVIVIAHSMGGLVARYWIAELGGWRRCAALIGLGVPHRGAPKALNWLVNGVSLGGIVDRRCTAAIRGWPSVYELLPQYEAVWDTTTGAKMEWTALPDGLVTARPKLAPYAAQFKTMAADARTVHDTIRSRWQQLDPKRTPKVTPYFTRGHATPGLATFDGRSLKVVKQDPPWRGNVGWLGDGTVPALSAIPFELGDTPELWRVVTERHGPIGSIHGPIEDLRSIGGDPVPTRGDAGGPRAWLGLDIDDVVPAGQEVPFAVTLLPAGSRAGSAWITVVPLDGQSAGTEPHELGIADDAQAGLSWRGVLAPLAVGRHDLEFEVMDVPGHGSVRATATVLALDPATLDDEPDGDEDGGW